MGHRPTEAFVPRDRMEWRPPHNIFTRHSSSCYERVSWFRFTGDVTKLRQNALQLSAQTRDVTLPSFYGISYFYPPCQNEKIFIRPAARISKRVLFGGKVDVKPTPTHRARHTYSYSSMLQLTHLPAYRAFHRGTGLSDWLCVALSCHCILGPSRTVEFGSISHSRKYFLLIGLKSLI